jgi:hypothetical protein
MVEQSEIDSQWAIVRRLLLVLGGVMICFAVALAIAVLNG